MRGSSFKIIAAGSFAPLLIFPIVASAEIVQIGFTTQPQVVSPGEVSGAFTFQLQDLSGSPAQADETFDIQFVSTSAAGEFLSPTTENPATKTLSTGSANKNFRYRDTVPGVHTITINARGRVSGLEVSGSQEITVSANSSGAPSISPASSPSNKSAYSPENKKAESGSAINIGKDRIGSVGSPMEFKAETSLASKKKTQFRWNFGDGSEEYGQELVHTYEYPGDYIVVLTLFSPDRRATSRINVKIVEPSVEIISASPEKIEVKNGSKQEISLYGWALWAQGKTFLFPAETLLKANQTIAFSSKVTGLKPDSPLETQLFIVGQTERPKLKEKIEALKQDKISALQYKILELQEVVASRSLPKANTSFVSMPSQLISVSPSTSTSSSASAAASHKSGWLVTLKRFLLGNK